MTGTRSELALRLTMTVLPAFLLIADATIYSRPASLLMIPAAAAVALLAFGVVALLVGNNVRGKTPAKPAHGYAVSLRHCIYLGAFVLALILVGPRLSLPVFGLLFARVQGASWLVALATGAGCAVLVEVLLVRLLEQPLPLVPGFAWLSM
jgi:hypothetical protein